VEYTIQKVDGADEEITINRMHKVCFPGAETYPIEWAEWWLARTEKGAPAGFAALRWGTNEGVGYLCRAGVIPAHRGQGLQKRLIKVREAYARKQGLIRIVSDTMNNYVSSNHLIDCGFRLFNPVTPWGNEGALYLRKELE
jgi:GNAT superfamily N-acetyltransferase